jgi:hypothetical protein
LPAKLDPARSLRFRNNQEEATGLPSKGRKRPAQTEEKRWKRIVV